MESQDLQNFGYQETPRHPTSMTVEAVHLALESSASDMEELEQDSLRSSEARPSLSAETQSNLHNVRSNEHIYSKCNVVVV